MKTFIVTLGLVLLLANTAPGQRRRMGRKNKCWMQRGETYWTRSTLDKIACRAPKEQLVTLPVPEGYDWVHPSVALVKKCSGHMCVIRRQQCVGTSTANLTFTVDAHKMDQMKPDCKTVTVVEDQDCDCLCVKKASDCTQYQEFSKNWCKCECLPNLHEECITKMQDHPGMYMWSPTTCTCPCNTVLECSTGSTWVPEFCRCMNMNIPMNNEIEY